MVDDSLSDFQLIWFFTTMTFFFWKMSFFFQKRHGWTNFRENQISVGDGMVEKFFHKKKKSWTKYVIERIIFSKFGQKCHGWAEICRNVTYFSFLPTMTFFFLNVMVDENWSYFQLIWFFKTMTFFLENVIFFLKTSWLEKFPRSLYFSRGCTGGKKFSWQKKIHRANNFF